MAVISLDSVRSFFRAPKLDEALGALAHNPPTPPIRTSWVWDSHIVESAGGTGKGKLPQTVSLSWDENEARGIESSMRSWQGLSPRERKEILLAIYLANSTVSACVDVIANRICSGGFTVEKINEEAEDNQEHYDQLMEFCLRVNDDWDFLQYARASLTDQLIFGETYTEILWQAGIPFQLAKVDCITMHYRVNRSGQILRYEQQLTSTSEINKLDPKDIIRWWRPHPRASIDPFSPIEKVQDAVNLDKKMVNWITMFFQKGAKFPYTVEFPGEKDEAERFLAWFRQNYTGEKNAHLPPVTWGGAKINATGKGSLEVDFPGGRDRNRTEVLSAYHVPPAAVSIIESGNIGGGTGEDQDKSLQYNACDPVKSGWLEKFNYRITQQGFKINDYRIGLRYADFRNDESLAKVQDTHIRNGSITINEARAESGKRPYKDGGDTPIVTIAKDVYPVPRFDEMEDEQAQNAQLDIEAKQVANDKAKNPPEPVMTPGQEPANQQGANNIAAKTKQANDKQKGESDEHRDYFDSGRDNRKTIDEYSVHTDIDRRDTYSMQDGATGRRLHSVESSPLTAGKADGGSSQALSGSEEVGNAQPTQSPAHQPTDARLSLLSQATNAQESTTETGKVRGAATEDDTDDTQQSDRDKLTAALVAIFLLLQSGTFSTDAQNKMVDLLAEAYIAARVAAYGEAFLAIGSDATWTPDESDIQAAQQWAQEQVGSISQTFEEMFKNAAPATPEEAKQFIDKLVEWKPGQIANFTIGSGADAGTRSAVEDMLDALTQVDIDTSLIPDGLSADQIRLRVVPDSSSSDFCSEYAGKDYALDEAGDIPFFPAHIGCIHGIEVYTVGGTDEPEELV